MIAPPPSIKENSMAKKKLSTFVTVHDDDGAAHTFGPSDSLPKWAREKITNPNVWAGEATDESGAGEDSGEAGTSPSGSEAGSSDTLAVPPMVGKGSSAADWRVYALAAAEKAGLSIEVPEDAKRADIIAALEGAQIPVK